MATLNQKGISAQSGTQGPTVWCTLGHSPGALTTGTEVTASVTVTYIAELWIPINTTVTGLALLNATAVAGNVTVALYDSTGAIVARSASTAASGTAAFQLVPFLTAYAAKGPGKYYAAVQANNTGQKFRAHANGVASTTTLTGGTYGTFVSFTPPTTFTADVGPIAATY